MRDTGKLLEPYGFNGSGTSWVRVEPGGVASVGRTRASRTWTGGQQVLSFGLALSATPIAWWEWLNWRNAQWGHPATPLEEATGPGLITTHGLPSEMTDSWSLRLDPQQPGQHALQADIDIIRAELPRRVHTYARRALKLLEPDRYLDELLAHPDPGIGTWEAIVILLADHGPSPQLSDAINHLQTSSAAQNASTHAETTIAYAQASPSRRPCVPFSADTNTGAR